MNIADGFIINTYKETNNVKGSYDIFFKKIVNSQKLQQGISLLGIDGEKYKGLLSQERHKYYHYIYSKNSLSAIIYENNLDKDCITHRYQMAQELKRMGITMK